MSTETGLCHRKVRESNISRALIRLWGYMPAGASGERDFSPRSLTAVACIAYRGDEEEGSEAGILLGFSGGCWREA